MVLYLGSNVVFFSLSLSQLVDSVDPEADENLLELMVRIAENPEKWRSIHAAIGKSAGPVRTGYSNSKTNLFSAI